MTLPKHATESNSGSNTKLADVARIAGVSISTASRALSRPEMVSEDTREAVLNAAKSVGYHPNLIARSLRTQSTNTVFVLLPSLASPFYPEIIRGLDWAAHERGYTLMLGLTGNEPGRQESYIDIAQRQRTDGLVVLDISLSHLLSARGGLRLPVVQVLERDANLTYPSVTIDEAAAAEMMTRHLIELGHRRVAHITGSEKSTITALRLQGYRSALDAYGLPFCNDLAVTGNFQVSGGKCAMTKLLALAEPPTAVFCANDETALGALGRATELGLDVPGDISIVGFDDIEQSSQSVPPLTTIRQPRFDIGATAMSLLLDTIGGKARTALHVTLPVELVLRDSSAPPKPRSASRPSH